MEIRMTEEWLLIKSDISICLRICLGFDAGEAGKSQMEEHKG